MAAPFVIKYNPVESDQDTAFELLDTWNDRFESRYSTVHADVSQIVSFEDAMEARNETLEETEELDKAVQLKKENENQDLEKQKNDL